MAGIQLPHIQANPEQQVNAPRVEAHPLDVTGPMKEQASAINNVGNEILRYQKQVMYQEADNKGTQRDNEWQDWNNKEMNGDPATGKIGLKYVQGDPKPAYEAYAKRAQEKLNELSSPDEGEKWNDLTQTVVNRRLNHRVVESHNESLTEYGHLKYNWDKSSTDANIDFAQKGMVSAAADVDPEHPETFGKINSKIQEITDRYTSFARSYGGAVDTEDGGTILTPHVKQQIAKAISDGLYKTIDNLYNSDQGDGVALKKADALKEQYADQLDPFHKDNLGKKERDAVVKQKGLAIAGKIMHSDDPEAAANALVKDIKDPAMANEVKDMGLKYASEQNTHINGLTKTRANLNYKSIFDVVDPVMRSDTPYPGVQAMRDAVDHALPGSWEHMTPAQEKTIEGMVNQPKNSSDAAVDKMVGLFEGKAGVKITGMSQADFAQYKAGLDKHDQQKYQQLYEKFNIPTNAQLESQVRLMTKELDDAGVRTGAFNRISGSQYLTPSDTIKEKLWKQELLDTASNLPPMAPKEMRDYVGKFVADKKAGAAFTPPQSQKFNGGTRPPPAASVPPPAGKVYTKDDVAKYISGLKPAAYMQLKLDYMNANHVKISPTDDQLNEFTAKKLSGGQ